MYRKEYSKKRNLVFKYVKNKKNMLWLFVATIARPTKQRRHLCLRPRPIKELLRSSLRAPLFIVSQQTNNKDR